MFQKAMGQIAIAAAIAVIGVIADIVGDVVRDRLTPEKR